MNDDGLPLLNVGNLGTYELYPVQIGNYLLEQVTKWYVHNEDGYKTRFLRGCDAMLALQDSRGGWPSNFKYTYAIKETGDLAPGWYSALAQGFLMSAMVRAYSLTGDNRYLASARRGAEVFKINVAEGGVRRSAPFGDSHFYEEYPTPVPSHILNGFMFSLFGLYDTWQATKDAEIEALFTSGMRTLLRHLSAYDLKDVSSYDLTHLTCPGNAANFHNGYHLTHLRLLSALNLVAPDAILERVAQRWVGYAQGNKSRRLDPKRFNLTPEKTLIDVRPGEMKFTVLIDDAAIKDEDMQCSFSVSRDGAIVHRGQSGTARDFSFQFSSPGRYTVSCLVVDKFGNRVALRTDFPVRSDEMPPMISTSAHIDGAQIKAAINVEDMKAEFAFYVLRGGEVVHKQMYKADPNFMYTVDGPGVYSVRCYAKRAGEPPYVALEPAGEIR